MHSKPSVIGTIPAFSIIILAVGLMNHVMVIPPLLSAAGRDSWVSVLAVIAPYLAWTGILYFIMRRTNQKPLLPWLREHYGAFVSLAFRLFFIVYLFFIIMMTVFDTTVWTHGSYLPRTPLFALSVSLVALCAFAAYSGMRAIAIASGFLLPFVIFFGDFVMSSNLPDKNYSLLTPVLEYGMQPLLRGCVFVGGGLVELILLLLFQHELKSKLRFWSMGVLSLFLVMLVFGPVTGAIAEFGPTEAAKLRYPAYEEWRLVTIGKYIQHVDFLSIYQWLAGAFARISMSMLLLAELLAPGKGKSKTVWLILLSILASFIVVLPISDIQYATFLKHIYLPGSLWIVTGLLLILFVLTLFSNKANKAIKTKKAN